MLEDNITNEIEDNLKNTKSLDVKNLENDLVVVFDEVAIESEISSQIKEAILYILSELSDNVKQHSKASKCWVLYKKYEKNLVILVADNGIGIPAVFEEHFPDSRKDDLEKILDALERGVSTKGEGRGYGLRTTRGIVDATAGEMTLISGGVGFRLVSNKKEPFKSDIAKTVAFIKIPADTKLESSQFYKIVEGKK